jgi:hypothetical protein
MIIKSKKLFDVFVGLQHSCGKPEKSSIMTFLILLALPLLSLASSNVNIRGLDPQRAATYVHATTFDCNNKEKTNLPIALLNDNFCDCFDGKNKMEIG